MGEGEKNRATSLILIVDDDRAERLILRRGLEKEGYKVLEGENGFCALTLCEEHHPDLVIMDCMMPVLDGFTACAEMQKVAGDAACPVLLLTGLEDSHSLEMAMRAGAVDFISKPINWKLLRQRVRRIISSCRAEKLLAKSESVTKSIMEGSLDGILVLDSERRIVSYNPAAETVFGFSSGEVFGLTIDALLEPVPGDTDGMMVSNANGQPATTFTVAWESKGRRKDGSSFIADCAVSGFPSGDRILTVRDISRQKEAENETRRTIMEALPIPVFFKGLDGSLLGVNRAYEKFHGVLERDLLGKSVYDIMPASYADFHDNKDRQLLAQGGVSVYEAQTYAAGGEVREVMIHKSSFAKPDGQPGGLIGTIIDISGAKSTQRRIHRLSQMYLALARTNDLIAFADDEGALFREVCRIAVETGQLSMCWIGIVDESGFVKPVASCGYGTRYLDNIVIRTAADVSEGRGPTGTAIRTNQPVVVNNYPADESMRPWHELGAIYGWKACASFPIPRVNRPYAALSVNYIESITIDAGIIDLLDEIAKNISRALDRIDYAAEHLRAVTSLAESEAFNRGLIESTHEGVCVWDAAELLTFVNQRAMEIFGYEWREKNLALGQPIANFLVADELDDHKRTITERRLGSSNQFERWVRHRNGDLLCLLVSATPRFDGNGSYLGGFAMFTDITDRKADQERIERMARFDDLTGLPNRFFLDERFRETVKSLQGNGGHCALMFLDLDNFKHINDTLGHHVGDQLLIAMAMRLTNAIRKQDTVSRLGGDEFIFLLPGVNSEEAASVAQNLVRIVGEPINIDQYELTATPSIGIAMYPTNGEDLDNLYRCADIAMYEVKKAGRNSWRFYAPQMQRRSQRQVQLLSALRRAVENQELMLYYQPQVSLRDGSVVGLEALLRWNPPLFGMVSPSEFIPIAEESGLIVPIGEWVLRTAVGQMKTFLEEGMPAMPVAVNLSGIQLLQPSLPGLVIRILQEYNLPGRHLVLELTESVAMKETEMTTAMMDALAQVGVRMAIDDFGTGYSSLAYLKRFRSYKLKIDQSFIRNMVDDPETQALVHAIISMAESLGMLTIAEGVENEDQINILHKNGCGEVQGYYYSRPLPANLLLDWMMARLSQTN